MNTGDTEMKKVWLLIAIGLFVMGCGSQSDEQAGQFQATDAQHQNVPQAQMPQTKELVEEGINHLHEAEIAEAIQSFDEAIRENPLDPEPYVILGQTYIRLKQYDRAIDTFSAAERIAPQRGDIQYLLAISYGLKGQEDLARESARRSIELFRQDKDEENFLKALALLQGLLQSE